MISCDECQKKMVAVFDNEGGPDDESLIGIHLKDCSECRAFREDMVRIRQQFGSAPLPGLSPGVREGVMQAAAMDSTPKENGHTGKASGCQPLLVRFPKLAWAAGLAAVFLIAASWLVSLSLSRKVATLRQELETSRQEIALAREKEQLEEAQERQQKAITALYFRMRELEERVDRPGPPRSAHYPAEQNGL